jgi:hypothetical protein
VQTAGFFVLAFARNTYKERSSQMATTFTFNRTGSNELVVSHPAAVAQLMRAAALRDEGEWAVLGPSPEIDQKIASLLPGEKELNRAVVLHDGRRNRALHVAIWRRGEKFFYTVAEKAPGEAAWRLNGVHGRSRGKVRWAYLRYPTQFHYLVSLLQGRKVTAVFPGGATAQLLREYAARVAYRDGLPYWEGRHLFDAAPTPDAERVTLKALRAYARKVLAVARDIQQGKVAQKAASPA